MSVTASAEAGLQSAERLTFDAKTHTYRLDGKIVPSVTTVLKHARIIDYSFIPQDVLQSAAKRGTAVHIASQLIDEGELDRETVDPAIQGYIDAYERFLEESRFTPAHIEHRVFHDLYRYAGTLDRTGLLNGTLTLLDLKTGVMLPGHAIQLAAYANCMPGPRRFRRINLKLCEDGTYRVYEYPSSELQQHIQLFLSALACYNFHGDQPLS